jgi:hypothetical protein
MPRPKSATPLDAGSAFNNDLNKTYTVNGVTYRYDGRIKGWVTVNGEPAEVEVKKSEEPETYKRKLRLGD